MADDERPPALFELLIIDGIPTVRGEVDLVAAPELTQWLASLDVERSHLDLSGVTFMGSAALRVFVEERGRTPSLRITRLSNVVRRLLDLTETEYLTASGIPDKS
jgi:anti-anti-sigma factor